MAIKSLIFHDNDAPSSLRIKRLWTGDPEDDGVHDPDNEVADDDDDGVGIRRSMTR